MENKQNKITKTVEKKSVGTEPRVTRKNKLALVKGKRRVGTQKPSRLSDYTGVLVVGVINILSLVAILLIVSKLPATANEFNKKKAASEAASTKNLVEIAKNELDLLKGDIDELASYYPDESGLVSFVGKMEELKENTVVGYSFANKEPVVDTTGALAVPVIIEFSGTWQQIDVDLAKIEKLPFIIRFVEVESEQDPSSDIVSLKYGGFIYVDEGFNKD